MWGTAKLTFVTDTGETLTAENNTVEIPTFSEEELLELAEGEYNNSARAMSLEVEDQDLNVKLTKMANFTSYSGFGVPESALRADIEVRAKTQGYF